MADARSDGAPVSPLASKIDAFARGRGGLHAGPFRMPYRTLAARDSACFLFFVGGAVAQAAWVATEGTFGEPMSDGKMRYRVPGVESVTITEVGGDVLFERVEEWPRAVRVVVAAPTESGIAVAIESLAARDQPSGLHGLVIVEDDVTSGSRLIADRTLRGLWSSPLGASRTEDLVRRTHETRHLDADVRRRAQALLGEASKSVNALAQSLGNEGVDVYEVWQRSLTRWVEHVDAKTIFTSARAAAVVDALGAASLGSSPCATGVCLDAAKEVGAVVAERGGVVKLVSIALRGRGTIRAESTPTETAGDEAVMIRAQTPAEGTLRSLTRVEVGDGRVVSVVRDDGSVYLVERDGPLSTVTALAFTLDETVDARVADLDGDGTNDIALFVRHPDGPAPAIPSYFAFIRSASVDGLPENQPLRIGIDMLGARDVDEAVRNARQHAPRVTPKVSEACALLLAASTPAGFRAHATPSARMVFFDSPGNPAAPAKILDRAHALPFASKLARRCDGSDSDFTCADGLCENDAGGLPSFFRFVRVGGVLSVDLVMLYAGS